MARSVLGLRPFKCRQLRNHGPWMTGLRHMKSLDIGGENEEEHN